MNSAVPNKETRHTVTITLTMIMIISAMAETTALIAPPIAETIAPYNMDLRDGDMNDTKCNIPWWWTGVEVVSGE